ncbi:MAG: hypothetical protein ABI972_14960 [Acidobacteriota bacterium]
MRERKIREANVLFWVAAMLFAYGVFEYLRSVLTGGRPGLLGQLLATATMMVLCTYSFLLLARFTKVRFKGYPWAFMEDRGRSRLRWAGAGFMVLFAIDSGLRFYQWKTRVEWVTLPDQWVSSMLILEYILVEEFAAYRRWLRVLA